MIQQISCCSKSVHHAQFYLYTTAPSGTSSICSVTTRRYPFWRERILPKLATFVAGIPRYSFGSVDVTNKCNLRCRHCYYFSKEHTEEEIGMKDMIDRVKSITDSAARLWSCTWVGGEPLLRKEVIEKLLPRFKCNLIVTNGSVPLPDWKNVSFYVSLDGTKEIHDKIRGYSSFERMKSNVEDPKNYGKTIRLACCLNRLNKDAIEDILTEWYPNRNIKEIVFDFFTPVAGADNDLWIDFEERDHIIDKILKLKRSKYGRFIGASESTYLLMKKNNRHQAVGKNCVFMQKGFAIDAYGNLKSKCMLGSDADCDKCGCIVPFYIKSLSRKNLLRGLFSG